MNDEPVRLNKAIADAGICSRRKADELIARGSVAVNGRTVVELGFKVRPGLDSISIDGLVLPGRSKGRENVYLMVHKPVQVVSTVKDPQGRQTVLDLIPGRYEAERLYPVGRLDYFSEGLLLLTNDGPLTHKLTHPSFHLPRKYQVTLRERPSSEILERMRAGMRLAEGERLAPVEIVSTGNDGRILEMTLHQGVNRQIRRMCRDSRLTILKLVRVAFGPLALGNLPAGGCRELSKDELERLKNAVESKTRIGKKK